MPGLLSTAISRYPGSPLRSVDAFQAHPEETQRRILSYLLSAAKDTEWGRKYDFSEILKASDVIEAFRSHVPLHAFDAFRRDVERMRDGETDILWPGRTRHFAVSSGTTSSGRIVPVSRETLRSNVQFSLATGLDYVRRSGRHNIFFGKQLSLPSWIEDDRQKNSRVGQISAILSETAPWIVKAWWQAVPDDVAHIQQWQDKMRAIADAVVDQDIRTVVFAPSWGHTLFTEVVRAHNRRTRRHAESIGEIWPNLSVVVTGAVALSSYRTQLEALIQSPKVDFVESYGASEGFFAYQTDLDDPAMLLHLDNGLFLEFVRQEELGHENPRRFAIHEVETGVRYAIVLSSNSGLWTYPVGDIVRFTQLDPHKIVVAGRVAEMLDKFGEATYGDTVNEALQAACRATDASALHYHVTHTNAGPNDMPAHQWLIEFDIPPSDMETFIRQLDEHLKHAGHHYYDRRECLAFDRPEIVSLPRGTFHRWLETTGKRVTMQTKVPRMLEERVVADALLSLVNHA